MSDPVISVLKLGKSYLVGHEEGRERYASLRENVARSIRSIHRKTKDMVRGRQIIQGDKIEEFWALRNITFEVDRGEVVGIIGRNGAGKTTLLKVLSRITDPTEGRVLLRGRVASLLEVGTGFHPELTGRENIFLNGAVLGMTKSEIRRKFDEIVSFSGVEKFLDTPVKRYSSGMYVRLAFSVAAHLEPEVLLVDEVLAVGDIEFQRKCLGKMDEVSKSGRTILFISHNMTAIEYLCGRCILLKDGGLAAIGSSDEIISEYLGEERTAKGVINLVGLPGRYPSGWTPLKVMEVIDGKGRVSANVRTGSNLAFRVKGDALSPLKAANINFQVRDVKGVRVTTFHSGYQHRPAMNLEGEFIVTCQFLNCRLMPGTYYVDVILKSAQGVEYKYPRIPFIVETADLYGTGKMLPPQTGFILPETKWKVE